MWTYNKQIAIRWVSFVLGVILVAYLVYAFKCNSSYLTFREMAKTSVANFSAYIQTLPVWVPCVGFIAIVIMMSFGVPNILFFGLLLVAYNIYVAFIVTFAAQLISSCICMRLSYKFFKAENFPGELFSRAEALKDNCVSFALWSRVYFTFPLRTIDSFLPIIHSEKENLNRDLIAACSGIFIRMIIPSLWLNSIYTVVVNVDFTPSIEKKILFWTSALIVYAIIPRAPELIICPEKFKDLLFKITPYTVAKIPPKVKTPTPRDTLEKLIVKEAQENNMTPVSNASLQQA